MARGGVNRREITLLIGAGLGGAHAAVADTFAQLHGVEAAAGTVMGPSDYTPPDTVAAVHELFRRMTVPVRVDGQGPFPFVVDTGANRSVIARELVVQLGPPMGVPVTVDGVAGAGAAGTTRARLEVGGRARPAAPLLVLREDDIGAAGLLGLEEVDGQAVTLDFQHRMLRVEPSHRLAPDPEAVVLPAHRWAGQLILVDASLDGQRVTAFIDTGSDSTIGNLVLRSKAAAREVNRPSMYAPILSATGQTIDGEVAELPRLRLGRVTVSTWPVTFADLYTFRMWRLVNRPAILLGADVLSRFDYVCLDFARNVVRVRLPRS